MPKGMFLKSEGFASNLYDPDGAFTLEQFCAAKGLGYADYNHPVPLDTFCAYGLAFQQRFAPDLEDEAVVSLDPDGEGLIDTSPGSSAPVPISGTSYAAPVVTAIAALIRSILDQALVPTEVILVDAGSRDRTVAVAQQLTAGDARFRILEAGPAWPGKARNFGVSAASCESSKPAGAGANSRGDGSAPSSRVNASL